VCSSLNTTEQVSHPYKTGEFVLKITGKKKEFAGCHVEN
jgi:hypothetical protein